MLARNLDRPIYTLDLRNHGESPHHPTHTYTAMALDVESLISRLSLPSPLLIGHSMGAKVAMTLALRSPHSYSGLVPVDNAPIDAALKSDFSTYVQAMKEIDSAIARGEITKQSEADKILLKYEDDLSIRQFLLTNLVKGPVSTTSPTGQTEAKTGLRWRIPLTTLAKALPAMADFPFKSTNTDEERQYKGPTLVVRGSKSHYVSDETLPAIGAFFPRFELLELNAGHWVMAERPEEFARGLGEWIRRCVDGDGDGDG
jgi:pimeloyl-ACP methyl ester carboxylesterase